ncbi:arsenate reductase ArsC [Ectobacillus polymachus]|uniref:arsenate reductase ArsC n=1 Tax=Ectobacillus polymachus TaxID=1508806 RepID=UPI003A8C0E61
MVQKPIIYFLCVQNSCRSLIAAAFANDYGKQKVEVYSAGVTPTSVHPQTIATMKEIGIDISGETADEINMRILLKSTVVVKLCEEVNEKCPAIPFGIRSLEWNIENPFASDNDECDVNKLRDVREEIHKQVIHLLQQLDVIPRKEY